MSEDGFSEAERAAMKQRAQELKEQAKPAKGKAKRERDRQALVDAIAAMGEPDKSLCEAFDRIVLDVAPQLESKTWYGFPAYAIDGKVVTFLQQAEKFEARYATIGFNDNAQLDDGTFWPTSFAVTEITPEVEARLRELVARAVGS